MRVKYLKKTKVKTLNRIFFFFPRTVKIFPCVDVYIYFAIRKRFTNYKYK